jgi:protein-disulfide isomerase
MQLRFHRRTVGRAAAILAAGLLAGCAGDGANLLASGASSTAPAGLTTEAAQGSASERGAFDPFSDRSESDRPAREVIEKPTRAEVMQAGPLPEYSIGRADAPVTIVKYMSLTCPYCRRFQAETFPVLKREYIDTGKVRLIIREFPIGKTSGAATVALRCAPLDKYLALYEKFLSQQSAWVSQEVRHDAIFKVAQQVGMKRSEFDACLANQSMIEGLKWVKERGRQLGIIGTPNFFIENRLVKRALGMKEIREIVDPLLATR